jgi:hypothetical protein
MKLKFIYLFFFFSSVILGQEIPETKKGIITLTTNQKYEFTNLKTVNNQVIFINVATKSEFIYFKNAIKLIVDDKENVVYKSLLYEEEEKRKKEKGLTEKPKEILFKANYPDGIYYTKEDFINKKPNENPKIFAKDLTDYEDEVLESIENICFFYFKESDKKIKRVFAVSYKGYLYFQLKAILTNKNKNDNAQTTDFPHCFTRVTKGGENYFYTEIDLANFWAQGAAFGLGGPSGYTLAQDMITNKGIVWDFKNKEFNIFKNCKDFNRFIEKIHPESIQKFDSQQPDIIEIRKAIDIIK